MDPALWLPERGFEGLATRARLLCFAHAGGGPAAFGPWASALPRGVSSCPLRRPGREFAHDQPPLHDVHIIAHQAAEAIATLPTRPSILLGHSLGALVAYEVARIMQARGTIPRGLIVSGREAPQLHVDRPPIAALPNARFIAELDARYGGVPAEVKRSPELLARLLPTLRADLAASERYRHRPGPALRCPVWVCQGSSDHSVDATKQAAWADLSRAEVEHARFPGGHFFLFDPASGFEQWLSHRVAALAGLRGPIQE